MYIGTFSQKSFLSSMQLGLVRDLQYSDQQNDYAKVIYFTESFENFLRWEEDKGLIND